jgi:cytochrome c oxidase assembly protein subunit 15
MASISDSVASSPRLVAGTPALVRAHLLLVAALVVVIIMVGGATRLTESGLSITEWNLVTGILPPLSEAGWLAEFEKYRRIPQYLEVNRGMSLAEFQTIYLWEWGHRLLGRVIGLVYLAGFVFFLATGRLDRRLGLRMFGIGVMIGMQGVVGWFMVASGLSERVTVAPYMLGAHLTLACLVLAALVWLALDLAPASRPRTISPAAGRGALVLLLLVIAQIYLGALVAGTRSGTVYQTWPLMDGGLWPNGMDAFTPWWRNLFENTGTTQFVHRTMAYLILAVALWHALALRGEDAATARGAMLLLVAIVAQAAIGVATLWSGMHIGVALAHQGGMVVVLLLALTHRYRTRPV